MATNKVKFTVSRDELASGVLIFAGYLIALVFSVFTALGIIVNITNPGSIILSFFCLGIAALGVFMIVRGIHRKKLIAIYRKYVTHLDSDPYHSIDQLAANMNSTTETVKKNLLEMIHRNYFPDASIDSNLNRLVLPQQDITPPPGNSAKKAAPVVYVSVSCQGCGATNNIPKGATAPCEYCGNALSAT